MKDKSDALSVLNAIYGRAIDKARRGDQRQIRSVKVNTPGREISLAHVIGSPEQEVYDNLALNIGFHDGAIHHGAMGIINITPPESVVIAADLAVKSGEVDIGFMDRFSGTLIITGPRADVDQAVKDNLDFFSQELRYSICRISEQ